MIRTCPYTISGLSLERKRTKNTSCQYFPRFCVFFSCMGRHIKQYLYFTKYTSLLGYGFDLLQDSLSKCWNGKWAFTWRHNTLNIHILLFQVTIVAKQQLSSNTAWLCDWHCDRCITGLLLINSSSWINNYEKKNRRFKEKENLSHSIFLSTLYGHMMDGTLE